MTNLTNEELYNLFLQGNGCAFQELYGKLNRKMRIPLKATGHSAESDRCRSSAESIS